MPRRSRESSGTGIYHVMLRGINRQNIFYDVNDYESFLESLRKLGDNTGTVQEEVPISCLPPLLSLFLILTLMLLTDTRFTSRISAMASSSK